MYLRHQMSAMLVVLGLALAGSASADSPPQAGGDSTTGEINVDTSRPVAAVVEHLEQRHGVVITYEDPSYVHESDISDVTVQVRKDLHRYEKGRAPRVLVPRSAHLRLRYTVSRPGSLLLDLPGVIQSLLDTHAEQGNPGVFTLDRTDEMFHVIPAMVKNRDGNLVAARAVLDTRISISKAERTCGETLAVICSAVQKATGERFTLGMIPMPLVGGERIRVGASNEPARSVLIRILAGVQSRLSWQVFYDPGLRWHILNLHVVPENDESPILRVLPKGTGRTLD